MGCYWPRRKRDPPAQTVGAEKQHQGAARKSGKSFPEFGERNNLSAGLAAGVLNEHRRRPPLFGRKEGGGIHISFATAPRFRQGWGDGARLPGGKGRFLVDGPGGGAPRPPP